MNQMEIFKNPEFGNVRVIDEDGKYLFCGTDVARALGYSIPSKAVNTHCKGVSKMEAPTNGGVQKLLFIPEGDVYRLIVHSKLPSAERFERWVFDEVLPTIRQHGAYLTREKLWEVATSPEALLKLCSDLLAEREKNAALREDNARLQGKAVYTYSSMTKEEQSYSEKEHHTETVTADTEKSDLSVVLKALSPSIEYDDGEFRGTLYLDHSTISTVASGYTTKSYTVSTTKEIDNLDTNDMAYVPDTTTKNGVTVQLQSVDWQVQGTSLVDDILVPAQYKAVATYAGRASYRAATGYVTTAKYIGDIVAEGIESVTYTVIYTGTPSSILQRVVAKSTENFPIILIFLVVIALAITAVVLIWRNHKRSQEDTVYHEEFSEEEDEHEE